MKECGRWLGRHLPIPSGRVARREMLELDRTPQLVPGVEGPASDGVSPVAVALCVTAALVPLAITPGLLLQFDVTPKLILIFAGAAVAVWTLARSEWRTGQDRKAPLERKFFWWLAVSALVLVVSTVFSTSPVLSSYGGTWRRFGVCARLGLILFVFALFRQLHTRRRLMVFLRIVVASGAATAAYAVAQYLGWDPFLPRDAYTSGEQAWDTVRPPGTLGQATYLSNYLVVATFLAGALYSAETSVPKRVLALLAAFLSLAGVVVSGSRAGLLGVAAGILIVLLLAPSKWRKLGMAALLGAGVVAAGFYSSSLGLSFRNRVRQWSEDARGGTRLLLWRDTSRMAAHRLAIGYGAETFSLEFPRFQSEDLARAYPDHYHESPHNIALEAMIEQGMPGLAALAGLTALGFLAAWRARIAHPVVAPMMAGGLGAGVVAHQFTAFVLPCALAYYLAITLPVTLASMDERGHRESVGHGCLSLLARSVSAVPFLAMAFFYARHDIMLARVSADLDQGELQSAIEKYERLPPSGVSGITADLWFSRRLLMGWSRTAEKVDRRVALDKALEAAVRSVGYSDERHNALYHIASLWSLANDTGRAEETLRLVIEWAPVWYVPRAALARLLALNGRRVESDAEWRRAAYLSGGKLPAEQPPESPKPLAP